MSGQDDSSSMTAAHVRPKEYSSASDHLPLTIAAAAVKLRDGSLRAVELVQAVQARADALDEALGVYINRVAGDAVMAAAAKADEELAAGLDRGPLHGIPMGIKDIIATSDARTTGQSLILRPEFGQQGDAVVIARLRTAGAVITGKTTTMEYAVGLPDPSKGYPTPLNPFDLDYWAGGSSSGTGSGVAAGLFLGGLGTDTGGSIRVPSSWCGISGMKQTYGRVPRSGSVPLGFSTDHIGPMARSARDTAAILGVIAGHDTSDHSSIRHPVDDYIGALTGSVEGMIIGVDMSFLSRPECDPDVALLTRAAVEVFSQAGADVREIQFPLFDELTTCALSMATADGFTYHRPDLIERWDDYGWESRFTLGLGALVTGADYVQAQRVRRVALKELANVFRDHNVLVSPTCMRGPLRVDELNFATLAGAALTPYWDGAGFPAMSIPMGQTSRGLPVGLQLAGGAFRESDVFRAADAFQLVTDHHLEESPEVLRMLGSSSA